MRNFLKHTSAIAVTGSVLTGIYFFLPNPSQNSLGIAFSDAVIRTEWDNKWVDFKTNAKEISNPNLKSSFEKVSSNESESKRLFKLGCNEIYSSIFISKNANNFKDFQNSCALNVKDKKFPRKSLISDQKDINWEVFKKAVHNISELEIIKTEVQEDSGKQKLLNWCNKVGTEMQERNKSINFNKYCLK